MSQRKVLLQTGYFGPDGTMDLTVGWDQPLGTFFAFSDDNEGTMDTMDTLEKFEVYVAREFGVKLTNKMLGLLYMDRDRGVMNNEIGDAL